MSAASFWKNAKAAYWAGRKQDVYNIYDTATNMGNVRSSYNRAATVVGPQRVALETGLREDWQTYKRKKAYEAEAARLRAEKAAYDKLLSEEPQPPQPPSYVSPTQVGPGTYEQAQYEKDYQRYAQVQYQAALAQYEKDYQRWLNDLYNWRLTH